MQANLGTILRQWRTERGLSLNRLAQSAGVSQPTLSRWEAGKNLPRLSELDAVLSALGATAAQQQTALELLQAPRTLHRVRQKTKQTDSPLDGYAVTGGDLLRAMRLRKRLTLEAVAQTIGVPKSTLSRWESGGTWPSVERLHTLCYALGARAEEIAALTGGRFFACQQSASLSSLREQFERLEQQLRFERTDTLFDLQFLSMEARLLPTARKDSAALNLLAQVWSSYSQWLSWHARTQESIASAERVLELARAKVPIPRTSVIGAINACAFAVAFSSPRKAIEFFHLWRTYAVTLDEQIILNSEIGFLLARPTMPNAQGLFSSTLNMLTKQIAKQDDPVHFHFLQRLRAEMRLREGRPDEACSLLPPLARSFHSRIEEMLLRIEILLAMSERDKASALLSDLYTLIETIDNASYREQAAAFARQLQ